MSDTNEHSLSLSYQIRRAIKAEDELQVAQNQIKLLTDQWNALPIKELVVNADYREMWQRQLKMNQQLNATLSAEKQAQPERAPFSDSELEQEFCNITGLETGINPAAADTKRALVWFKKGYAHGIKQGGQHE